MKAYELKPQVTTALIAPDLMNDWHKSIEDTGLNNTQALTVAFTLLYADPAAWVVKAPEGKKPVSANFKIRLPGIIGTWMSEIQDHMSLTAAVKATGTPVPVSKAAVVQTAMIYFIDTAQNGGLMSTMNRKDL